MVERIFLIIFLIIFGCSNPISEDKPCVDCGIEIYCDLPKVNDVYQMTYDTNGVMTYEMLYVETECGLHTKVSWDTDYQYKIESDWVSLVNPSSMTDEDGIGRVIFGTWRDFIGYTITVYGGYTDECGVHHVDSLRIKVG